LGRHGTLIVPGGKINLRNSQWKEVFEPPLAGCTCPCCSNFTLAYLSHLMRAKENFGGTLCSLHNIHILEKIMAGARRAIRENRYKEYKKAVLAGSITDLERG
jgi:queuine tRNA-ribosyltransferase